MHERTDAEEAQGSPRSFGIVISGAFLLLGLSPLWHYPGKIRVWAVVGSAFMALLATAFPRALIWPTRFWTKLGLVLHQLTSPVALLLIYVLAVIPTALLMRVMKKDPLRRDFDAGDETYWIMRLPPGRPAEKMKNQF